MVVQRKAFLWYIVQPFKFQFVKFDMHIPILHAILKIMIRNEPGELDESWSWLIRY